MTTIDPLTHQVAHGQYALAALREAENLMSLIAQWDVLREDEKAREYGKGRQSRFAEVPGFEPVFCETCGDDRFFDYRDDPEGACMTCRAWAGRVAA